MSKPKKSQPDFMPYHLQLKDPRWQKRRLEILSAANWKCEECDTATDQLSVHHSFYLKGMMAWEHPHSLLHALCDTCHIERQSVEESLKVEVMKLLRYTPARRIKKVFWFIMAQAMTEAGNE